MDCDGSFVPEIEMSKVKLTESVGASTYKATLARPPSGEQKRSTSSLCI